MACCGGEVHCAATTAPNVRENVKEYYSNVLTQTSDLQEEACTLGNTKIPARIRDAMALIHEDVAKRYYGCGLVVPDAIEGCKILDLGCGAGMDCFVLSQLVGDTGLITGLDMTQEQLEVASKYIDYHMEKFGFQRPNINFVQGYIEHLTESGIKEKYYDVIVSNCVVNLSPDKLQVLTEACNVLKTGGELYFSDVYCDRVLPEEVRTHKVLWGECISGALYWRDLYSLAQSAGFTMPRLVSARNISIQKPELKDVVGDAQFVSATFRLFKLPTSTSGGGVTRVIYEGTIAHCEQQFNLDFQNSFPTSDVVSVSSLVADIIRHSRLASHFTIEPGVSTKEKTSQTLKLVNPFVVAQGISLSGCCVTSSSCCDKKC